VPELTVYEFVVKTDGEWWYLHCDQIPGLNVGGKSADRLFESTLLGWRKLYEYAPDQVPKPPAAPQPQDSEPIIDAPSKRVDAQQAELERLRNDGSKLRSMLGSCYAGAALYRDDGELQDSRCRPHIDFRRDTVDEIEEKMLRRARAALAARSQP
jgi:hypothetical protein